MRQAKGDECLTYFKLRFESAQNYKIDLWVAYFTFALYLIPKQKGAQVARELQYMAIYVWKLWTSYCEGKEGSQGGNEAIYICEFWNF